MSLVPEFPDIINNIVGTSPIYASFINNTRPGLPQAIADSTAPGAFPTTATFTATAVSVGTPPITTTGSAIILPLVGNYRVIFSLQLEQGAGNHTVTFWLILNGVTTPDTSSYVALQSNSKVLAEVEFFLTTTAINDSLQLYLISDGANSALLTVPAVVATGYDIPQSPAIVMNIEYLGT
jgi:hypothetical protein